MDSSSPHYIGTAVPNVTIFWEGEKLIVKPQALKIIWGGDPHYWVAPTKDKPSAELLKVCWLEVEGKLKLSELKENTEYTIRFMVRTAADGGLGWSESPVYLRARPGKDQKDVWRKAELGSVQPGFPVALPAEGARALNFVVPGGAASGDDELLFGMYEIWNGRWKGGLVIDEIVIEPCDA